VLIKGLPQGSPLSPVIFICFLTPIFGPKTRFGYIDNVVMYCRSRNPQQAGEFAIEETSRCIHWLKQNGVPADPGKTEFLRLVRGYKLYSTPVKLKWHNQPLKPAASVRYLRVWIEPTLKFKVHAHEVAERG